MLFDYSKRFIKDTWSSKDHIRPYTQANEDNGKHFKLIIIYAKDYVRSTAAIYSSGTLRLSLVQWGKLR